MKDKAPAFFLTQSHNGLFPAITKLITTTGSITISHLKKTMFNLCLPPYSIIFIYHRLKGHSIMPIDEIMTIKELAEYLKIAEKTAYRFASEGKIPGFKVGSAWRFKKEEIDAWIKRQSDSNTRQEQ